LKSKISTSGSTCTCIAFSAFPLSRYGTVAALAQGVFALTASISTHQ